MKKLLFSLFFALVFTLMFFSCDKKQHAIDNLGSFVERVEKHASEYTEEDWAEVNKEYDELITEIDKYDYTGDDAKRIATLKGKFAGIKTKDTINKFIDGIDKAAKEAKETLEGFTEGFFGGEEKE